MIGKQVINNLLEFIIAISRSLFRWFSGNEQNSQVQWEIDNQLFAFDSNILIDEYLELGPKIVFISTNSF